jgi:hypothetical protein
MNYWYYAQMPFPASRVAWEDYIQHSSAKNLKTLVTLDASLCPCAIADLTNEDWKHNVHEELLAYFFRDLTYLEKRVIGLGARLLAVIRSPQQECSNLRPCRGFHFAGYDIMDAEVGTSLLTYCGSFPLAFSADDLFTNGLLMHHLRADHVKCALKHHYPTNPHVRECQVWAIWVKSSDARGRALGVG